MAAHAPAPAPAGPTPGQLLGAVVNPPVALGLLVANKIWDPLADYIGYPCDRERRIDDHKQAVLRVIAMKDDFLLIGPCPPSLQSRHWIKCVEQLEKTFSEIQEKYLRGGYFNTCSCAREAIKETKRAEELAGQYKDLCIDIKARLLPVNVSQWEDLSLVTNSYKDLVIKFINDTSGKARLLGIWGMAGIGKSTLLRQVSKSRSEFISDGDDLIVLIVDTGSDYSVAKVQKCLIGLLGVTVAADVTEAGVALAISNRLRGMRFLVMFDDLSGPINLARIGIPDAPPASLKCQKVVFTTQKQAVCASMGADETIHMVCPSEIEAEKLFNHAVGADILKDKRISSLSQDAQDETQDAQQLLHVLQMVAIRGLSKLREVNLKTVGVSITSISISVCPALIDLSWIKDLINLEQLSVTQCRMLNKILSLDVVQQDTISMPKLKTVHLEGLEELTVIADLTLKLDNIVHFSVFLCSKLVGLPVVGERKPKVILDCDISFSDKILQDGNESPYSIRVA
ncbi:hypothetical protein CFC21_044502 [Triticum aestivum]|nr:disease resistance protein RPS2-like [Triticum aestivum]KAF7033398.1 hypothetical protein CFC21_044502 [Triticum aestivum]